jgi:hypothetical protein
MRMSAKPGTLRFYLRTEEVKLRSIFIAGAVIAFGALLGLARGGAIILTLACILLLILFVSLDTLRLKYAKLLCPLCGADLGPYCERSLLFSSLPDSLHECPGCHARMDDAMPRSPD